MLRIDFKLLRSLLITSLLAAAIWICFGPVQLGGPVAYVIISGDSMEPEIKLGDLVLSRRAASYEVGQAVVYHHPQIGFVYHRIVAQEEGAFILQGDHNEWLDSYHPTEEDILGKGWFVIPGAGKLIRELRQPLNFTVFALIIIISSVSIFLFLPKDLFRKKVRGSVKTMKKNQPLSSGDIRQEVLLLIGVIGLVSLIFCVFSFSKPLTRVVSDDLFFTHQGDFSYTARDQDNLYDRDQIQTGEPVYTQLTCQIEMEFAYQLTAMGSGQLDLNDFSGTYQVDAVISDVDGWKRTYNLVPETDFEGTEFKSEMGFDLCQAQALILDKEQKTDTTNRWYVLEIQPRVEIAGTVDGLPLEDSYQPAIEFQLDNHILRMPGGLEELHLSQDGLIENKRTTNNTMQVLGREINVLRARWSAVLGLIICLLAAGLPAWSLYKDWRASDVSRIQVQYHPLLVDVQEGSVSPGADQIVDVASFSDLSKMAERYGSMILHESMGSVHRYSVQDEGVLYQYILDGPRGEALFPDSYAFKRALLEGIEQDQFELYYQPVLSVKDQHVLGVEAFLRWNHPQHGLVYPVDFIAMAERGSLIPAIDSWVFNRVCQQLKDWQAGGVPIVPVSINLSPETVIDEAVIKDFQEIILQDICRPEYIQVEINRSNRVFGEKRFLDHLAALSDLGVGLVIDNFATDDANQINQVFQAPIKTLKIDRSVVQEMKSDPHAKQLVGAVSDMAKKFQVEVVAQGVETEQDLDLLKEQGIQYAQGFYLGKPMRADELSSLLAARTGK